MQTKLLVLIFSVAFVYINVDAVGKGKGKGKARAPGQLKPWKCNGRELVATEEQKEILHGCLEEVNENRNDPCYLACLLEGFEMVKDGKLNNEAVAKWIYMHVPKHASDEAELEWEKCAKEATEPLSRDNNCKSYKKLKECEGIAFAKICKIPPGQPREE